MTVMILERVPVGLRGELTRWLLEAKAGVFVGKVSALVRDKLWERACAHMKDGGGILIYASNTEQGFAIRFQGNTGRAVRDFDGLLLLAVA